MRRTTDVAAYVSVSAPSASLDAFATLGVGAHAPTCSDL